MCSSALMNIYVLFLSAINAGTDGDEFERYLSVKVQ